MWNLFGIVCMLILGSTSAIKLIEDYEEYSDLKHGEDVLAHWTGHRSDHSGEGRGESYHQDHHHNNAGETVHGDNKAGGHIKHHVTQGYKNYHHKDEVGQTTSYIDSSGDTRDHLGKKFLHNKWGGTVQGGAQHRDHHESEMRREKAAVNRKQSTEKKEDFKGNIGEFLYAKKPIINGKTFYSQVPLQYVPYPHLYY